MFWRSTQSGTKGRWGKKVGGEIKAWAHSSCTGTPSVPSSSDL